MNISPQTQLDDLIDRYPFVESFLAEFDPKLVLLKNKYTRLVLGRRVSLKRLSSTCRVDLDTLMEAVAKHVHGACGDKLRVVGSSEEYQRRSEERIQSFKEIIVALKKRDAIDAVTARLAELAAELEPHEIAEAEASLIKDGVLAEELSALYQSYSGKLPEQVAHADQIDVISGHPVNTYLRENERISTLSAQLKTLAKVARKGVSAQEEAAFFKDLDTRLEELKGIEVHYIRKEHLLFPSLERHGVAKPVDEMWSGHDTNRSLLKEIFELARVHDVAALGEKLPGLCRAISEMVFKENRILFPLAMNALTPLEWIQVRQVEDRVGYAFAQPKPDWIGEPANLAALDGPVGEREYTPEDKWISIPTGHIKVGQLAMAINHLPVEISYVDEYDEVRFYSEVKKRIFPRGPSAIGRKVQDCHPSKSLHLVNRILSEFRRGKKESAEFWFEMGEKFIHISYFAVRDAKGSYRGCLEMAQDIAALRKLEGSQRLPRWNDIA